MNDTKSFASWKAYHPSGKEVTFSVDLGLDVSDLTKDKASQIMNAMNACVEAGFAMVLPGAADPNEEIFTLWGVIRRAKYNPDGSTTPVIDFYAEHTEMKWRRFTHYLNKPEDVLAFEAATGVSLAKLSVYEGDQALNKDSQFFIKYIVQCPRQPKVALIPNPRHDPAETDVAKKKAKNLFGRWVDVPALSGTVVPDEVVRVETVDNPPIPPSNRKPKGGTKVEKAEGEIWPSVKDKEWLIKIGEKHGWTEEQIAKALGIRNKWSELIQYKNLAEAQEKMVRVLGGTEERVGDVPF